MSAAPHYLFWKSMPLLALAALSAWAMHRLILATTPRPVPSISSRAAGLVVPVPFLQQWCYDCHGDGAAKGDFVMDGPQGLTDSDWDKIRRHVLLRTMPPEDKPAPPPEAREAFEQDLLAWQAALPNSTFPAAFRRLSRREFTNSMRDLVGLAPAVTALPEEESAHGFDNNGDFQPLPPAALERYVTVIGDTLRTALLPAPVPSRLQRFMTQEFVGPGGPSPDAPLFYEIESSQPTRIPFRIATSGSYRLILRGYGHQAGEGPVCVSLMGTPPQPLRSSDRSAPDTVEAKLDLPAGATHLTFHLANPYHDPKQPDPHRRTRRLLVRDLALEGPLNGDTTPAASLVQRFAPLPGSGASLTERIAWAGKSIDSFTRRAWRRPLTGEEFFLLIRLAGAAIAHGLRDDEALVVVLQAVLTSPNFLFLPNPSLTPSASRPYAVAVRLSHLLWSTLPDESLLAECVAPWTPDRLTDTTRRLLDDPRAAAFARDFAGQWLQLRNTTLTTPDNTLFPDASPEVRAAMQHSAETFFLYLVRENEPVLRLLDADYTFSPPAGWFDTQASLTDAGFRKVTLTDPNQHGLLGHPAVLLLTSYPNRTSPVLRGKYILETLLGLEPPPPPPNVPTLQAVLLSGHAMPTVRASLELHRANRACAGCHRAIDPLGFPLEAFDVIGRPSGAHSAGLTTTTFTGARLHSPADLHAWLIDTQGLRIVNHTAERLLTYALGRGLTAAEIQSAHRLAAACGGRSARFRDLLLAVVTSPLFQGETIPSVRNK